MKETPTSGPMNRSSTHQELDQTSSRHSFSSSHRNGGLGERKEDLLQVFERQGCAASAGHLCQLLDRAFAANMPAAEEHEAVAEAGRIADLVDREEQSPASGGMGAQGGGDVAGLAEIEAVEGLVDEEGRLRRKESDGKQGALSLSFGKFAERLLEQWTEIELFHNFGDQRGAAAEEAGSEIEDPLQRLGRPRRDGIGNVEEQR